MNAPGYYLGLFIFRYEIATSKPKRSQFLADEESLRGERSQNPTAGNTINPQIPKD
jgi:hypothetical protein